MLLRALLIAVLYGRQMPAVISSGTGILEARLLDKGETND
jgi:hypothetical protein